MNRFLLEEPNDASFMRFVSYFLFRRVAIRESMFGLVEDGTLPRLNRGRNKRPRLFWGFRIRRPRNRRGQTGTTGGPSSCLKKCCFRKAVEGICC